MIELVEEKICCCHVPAIVDTSESFFCTKTFSPIKTDITAHELDILLDTEAHTRSQLSRKYSSAQFDKIRVLGVLYLKDGQLK